MSQTGRRPARHRRLARHDRQARHCQHRRRHHNVFASTTHRNLTLVGLPDPSSKVSLKQNLGRVHASYPVAAVVTPAFHLTTIDVVEG